jgi:hypothetical protein
MPSLLQKLSFFDPETGGTFTVASDGFYWKEGKKAPEDSKVTKLLKQHGWKLQHGNNAFLIFKQKGNSGDIFVVRGNKRWFYELRDENGELYRVGMKGKGLDSLQQALSSGVLNDSLEKAAGAATAVNNAGNGHSSVDGDPLHEIHIYGYEATDDDLGPGFWPEGEKKWSPEDVKSQEESAAKQKAVFDRVRKELIQKSKGVLSSKLFQARERMHDDSGARTGLRSRPDYGESDSYTSEMNEANSKGACLVLTGGIKTASGSKQAYLYITSVKYERGYTFKLASFDVSPNRDEAKVFLPHTAENLRRQVRRLCGQTPKLAKPNQLLTTQNIKTQKKPNKELLTQHNLKTQKGESKGFLTGVMHMMPSDLSGFGNVCPCASPECRQMCLNTAGVWANAPAVQNSRRMKTELYFKNRPQFMADMRKSITSLVRKAEKNGLTPAVRINGTSDLPQVAMEMAKEFPEVQFYDYTKIPQPWKRQLPNYHITFSRSEINDKETMEALEHGVNVAVVFAVAKGEPMPKEWRGYPVLNGDAHDLRFLDKLEGEGPFVIGLSGKGKAKGKNKGTESGFVVDPKSLVQIGPAPTAQPKKKDDLVQIGQPPVSTTEQRIQERTRPATEPEEGDPFWEEKEEAVTASSEEKRTPHIEWFVEAGFDDAHLRV